MNKILTLALLFSFLNIVCFGQEESDNIGWRKHRAMAEESLQKRNYAEAAYHYEMAHKQKPQNLKLLYAAAENYLLVRDFKNAASSFAPLKNVRDAFPKAGLFYAISLKQDGKYTDAKREFAYFVSSYEGNDKPFVTDQVQKEIEGCEFAEKQMELFDSTPFQVTHLSEKINTLKPEFAPIPYSNNILYFSSMVRGKAKIFRSQKNDDAWSKGRIPRGFTSFQEEHFCNGSFTPDGERFYFTICESDQAWGALSARCDIYVTSKKGSAWKTPIKLPEYINLPNKTNTQPFVTQKDGKEIIYFSSNRASGQGGMDLWYAEKDIESEAMDFTFPVNLGPNINTAEDEITPFINEDTGVMYFSSNGHLTMGGFDILKSAGSKSSWSIAENIGIPFNSAADENYFVTSGDASEGYFASNRPFGNDKMRTTQEDIFSFEMKGQEYLISGVVKDELEKPLEEVFVYLYEFVDEDERRLLSSKTLDHTGKYRFRLLPEKRYQIALQKENFVPSTEYFNTLDLAALSQEKNINMTRINVETMVASNEPMDVQVKEEKIEPVIIKKQEPVIQKEVLKKEEVVKVDEIEVATVDVPMKKEEVVKVDEIEVATVDVPTRVEEVVESVKSKEINEPRTIVTESVETKIKKTPVAEEKVTEEGKEVITFVINGDEIKSVKIVDANRNIKYDSDAKPSPQIVQKSNVISSPIIRESTRTNSSSIRSDFIGKGNASVPSGTGLYKYDARNGQYVKEGGSVSNVITFSENSPISYDPAPVVRRERSISPTISSAPILSGSYYKIQMIAVAKYNENHKRYKQVKKLGKRLDSEYIVDKGWTRVMLADFLSKNEAKEMLKEVRKSGFERAYLVKYTDGQRVGRVK